ncbi:hypothetical protein C8R43DRAFT_942641 [Mycena crocata]|nr:hypothetical protein C8R43DRAFT_942641 [Mycena crocata]
MASILPDFIIEYNGVQNEILISRGHFLLTNFGSEIPERKGMSGIPDKEDVNMCWREQRVRGAGGIREKCNPCCCVTVRGGGGESEIKLCRDVECLMHTKPQQHSPLAFIPPPSSPNMSLPFSSALSTQLLYPLGQVRQHSACPLLSALHPRPANSTFFAFPPPRLCVKGLCVHTTLASRGPAAHSAAPQNFVQFRTIEPRDELPAINVAGKGKQAVLQNATDRDRTD